MSTNAAPTSSEPSFSDSFYTALMRTLNRPQFLAAFIVLLVAAVSLNAATQYLRLYFKKERVELAKPLEQIPITLGPWVQISKDQPLSAEMLDVLGTKNYIFRDYLDKRVIDEKTIADVTNESLTTEDRGRMVAGIRAKYPGSHIRMAVTYYTGMVDTVAHIPDRCYVADGMVPDVKETPVWKAADKNHQPIDVRVSSIHFEDSEQRGDAMTRNVAYFFHCNGEYEHDAISGVRMRLQNLAERHAYYAKIEVMTEMRDRAKSDQVIADFLTYALPEIEPCLPDWQKVEAGAAASGSTPGSGAPTGT